MSDSAEQESGFPWGHPRRFNDLAGYNRKVFGRKMQKLSVDAGFTCPNRDGTRGTGGCTFCNNRSFSPAYCNPHIPVTEQLDKGIAFFSAKYPEMGYLAYFQTYTNTYAPLEHLSRLYGEALNHPKISGMVIGTRPDCISDELLDYLSALSASSYVSVEYGVESTLDRTLERVNRGHGWSECVDAIEHTAGRGLPVGAHLILGLPGEQESDMLEHAARLGRLPLTFLKIHQLQIIRGTRMEQEYLEKPDEFSLFDLDSYVDVVVRFLELLNPAIVVERFASASSPDLIAQRRWGKKNHEIVDRIEKELVRRNTWQGRLFAC